MELQNYTDAETEHLNAILEKKFIENPDNRYLSADLE